MKIKKKLVVALLVQSGVPDARKWTDSKLQHNLPKIRDNIHPDDVAEEHKSTYDDIVKAVDSEEPIELESEEEGGRVETDEEIPAKKAKSKKEKKTATEEGGSDKPAAKKSSEAVKERKPRPGSLGTHKGFSISGVLRAMGKAGWTAAEARQYFQQEGIAVGNGTVAAKIEDAKGATGNRSKWNLLIPAIPAAELKAMRASVKLEAPSEKEKNGGTKKKSGAVSKTAKAPVAKTAKKKAASKSGSKKTSGKKDLVEA